MDLRTISEYGSLSFYPRLELYVPGSVFEVSCGLLCCFLARAPGSLAGGFLVAVAGRALFAVCLFFL